VVSRATDWTPRADARPTTSAPREVQETSVVRIACGTPIATHEVMLPTRRRRPSFVELDSSLLVDDDPSCDTPRLVNETDNVHTRPTGVMRIAAVATAILASDDERDTGTYQRPNEVDLLLAMVDASEASGSITIDFD
jgi:hypothetical protein